MISYLNDPNANLLKSYPPPFRGTWKTLPPHLLPDDAIQDSLNVTIQSGRLKSRAGLTSFNTTNLGNKAIGSFLFVDTTNTKTPFVSTKSSLFRYTTNWVDITNTTINGLNVARMTSIQIGVFVYLLYANGVNTIKFVREGEWLLKDIVPHAGTIPICTDICTSFSRIVGITPPYTIQWCDPLNTSYASFSNWPALNQVILADTEDSLVAIRSLGTLGLAVYKEGNIFVGFAQAGPSSQAFRFEHRGSFEGPANPNAIVNVQGTHIYMSRTGRIGIFDGTSHTWIGDGIWPFLQDDLDVSFLARVFGVYNYKTSEVYFWYPKVGDAGVVKGMIIVDLPYPLAGITNFSYFLGKSNFECTAALSIREFSTVVSPFVFGNTNQTFTLDRNSYRDNTTLFPCNFSTGLFKPLEQNQQGIPPKDKADIYRPIIELYASRDSTRGTVKVSALTSATLESDGVQTESEVIDLTTKPVNEFIGFNDTGSFLGVKFEWDSTSKFEFKAMDIYGRKSL